MSKTLIIDADVLVYKAAEASQEVVEIETIDNPDYLCRVMVYGNKKQAVEYVEKKINSLLSKTKCDGYILALSDSKNNFRKKILPSYKANRKTIKPVLYNFLRNYFLENHKTYEKPFLEGDDVIGILATSDKIIKGKKIIWSMDKDFKTIPCILAKEKPSGKIEKIATTGKEADWWFMYQTLIGDTTDGYTGCKNIGDKRARKILGYPEDTTLQEMWDKVVKTYEANNMTALDALNNARCARILRAEDYDFKKKEVKLWNPLFI